MDFDPFDYDGEIFEDTYDLAPSINNVLGATSKVCTHDHDVFYDAVSTLREGECDVCHNDAVATPSKPSFVSYLPLYLRVFILLMPLSFYHAIHGMVFSSWIQTGLVKVHVNFAYPCRYFILSCVMLSQQFCSWLWKTPVVQASLSPVSQLIFDSRPPSKPPDIHSAKIVNNHSNSTSVNLKRLALVSAIGILHSLPVLNTSQNELFKRQMRKKCTFAGYITPSLVTTPVAIKTLRDYFVDRGFAAQHDLIEGAFHCIVDSGCSTSASPHKEDFEDIGPLSRPVTLNGIAGNSTVTHGGILKYDCINTKGEIVTVRTFGFYHPNLSCRLFSPQSCF